ncbi:hypothetical protein PAEPH01_2667, partial [Pancytospora epiphaga]
MFKIVSTSNNLFRYYRTPTSFTTNRLLPQIKLIGAVPYLLVPTENSFYVYRLENLQLHFMGPMLEGLSGVYFNNYDILASSKDVIHRVDRGDVIFTYQFDGPVKEMVKFGEYLIVRLGDREIVILEQILNDKESVLPVDLEVEAVVKANMIKETDVNAENCDEREELIDKGEFLKEVYRFKVIENIWKIFHPHSYSNKVIIIYESGNVEIYNVYTRKSIFRFNLEQKIVGVGQTSVLDVLGFILEDGTVRIFNIKKNKL